MVIIAAPMMQVIPFPLLLLHPANNVGRIIQMSWRQDAMEGGLKSKYFY